MFSWDGQSAARPPSSLGLSREVGKPDGTRFARFDLDAGSRARAARNWLVQKKVPKENDALCHALWVPSLLVPWRGLPTARPCPDGKRAASCCAPSGGADVQGCTNAAGAGWHRSSSRRLRGSAWQKGFEEVVIRGGGLRCSESAETWDRPGAVRHSLRFLETCRNTLTLLCVVGRSPCAIGWFMTGGKRPPITAEVR